MIDKTYLALDGVEVAFENLAAIETFIKEQTKFSFKKKLGDYVVYLGLPLGIGQDKAKNQGPLYNIYGIAGQNKRGYLFGRKVPGSMGYHLTLKSFALRYEPTEHFALTNDIQAPTDELMEQILRDQRVQVSGVIVDHQEKALILTSVLPSKVGKLTKAG